MKNAIRLMSVVIFLFLSLHQYTMAQSGSNACTYTNKTGSMDVIHTPPSGRNSGKVTVIGKVYQRIPSNMKGGINTQSSKLIFTCKNNTNGYLEIKMGRTLLSLSLNNWFNNPKLFGVKEQSNSILIIKQSTDDDKTSMITTRDLIKDTARSSGASSAELFLHPAANKKAFAEITLNPSYFYSNMSYVMIHPPSIEGTIFTIRRGSQSIIEYYGDIRLEFVPVADVCSPDSFDVAFPSTVELPNVFVLQKNVDVRKNFNITLQRKPNTECTRIINPIVTFSPVSSKLLQNNTQIDLENGLALSILDKTNNDRAVIFKEENDGYKMIGNSLTLGYAARLTQTGKPMKVGPYQTDVKFTIEYR